MTEILVAIACNLVATLILVSGIFTSLRSGWKVALTRLILTLGSVVGTYFLTPFLSDKIWSVNGVATLSTELGISQVTLSSCLFLVAFLLFYAVNCIICSFVKHALIKGMQKSSSENRAKIKRAKSINPKAERAARRTIWRELKTEYKASNKWWKKVLSVLMGLVVYASLIFTVLLPVNYIFKDMDNNEKLVAGYQYTLNGVIGEDVMDEIVSAPTTNVEEQESSEEISSEEEQPSEEPSVEETPAPEGI